MKIYVSHSVRADYENEIYSLLRGSNLEKQNEFFLPHENGKEINSKEIIEKLDLILAEVSEPGTGQGIELGWASSKNIPIVCFYREGRSPSKSLRYVARDFISYRDSDDFMRKISIYLSSFEKS